jgi:hypothetical protein
MHLSRPRALACSAQGAERGDAMTLDLRPLAWSRAAVGALLLLRTTPLLYPLDIWFLRDTLPLLGWPDARAGAIEGGLALPTLVVQTLCIVRTIAALLFMLGVWFRAAGLTAGVTGYLVLAQNPFGFFFTVHLLYQAAILLALTDAASEFALRRVPAHSPSSSYWLVHAFVASVYFWAGIHKFRPDWLDGRTLELFRQHGAIHGRLADLLLGTPVLRLAAGTGVAIFETVIGPLLVWRRTRRVAVLAAFGFHAVLELTAHPDLLGWGMAALLLAFLEPTTSSDASRSTPSST